MSLSRRIAARAASALLRKPASARQVSGRALSIASSSPTSSAARPLPRALPFGRAVCTPSPSSALLSRRAYSTDSEHKIYSFEDVQKLTKADSDVVIIDAREPGELVATGYIPGAINIPVTSSPDSFFLSEDDFEDRFGFARPAADTEVVFYCKAGVRSRAAAALAKQAGWTNVGEYPGSWLDWAGNGGAIERS
ncbi:rhodanese domain containing protein [Ophiostoma piceae UAMH 11346]|uniref:Rhodanese domain containing protein n=1 Tax=Ophiostoma piceae (strain UAMH 11346) TaxID=1262450 RepID=S3BQ10_OPHP1|nr:rhodanese domain containing protein [Ophiostoma piceae UAMH 11346]